MFKKLLFLGLTILFFNTYSQDQLQYKITANDNEIGKLQVKKSIENNTINYSAKSDSKFKLFVSVDFSYKLNCIYKDNELLFSSVTTYVNGSKHSTATTEKIKANVYVLNNNGHENRIFEPIFYSGVLLYFNEPKNISKVYSEFYNNFNPLKQIAIHTYQLTNSQNGNLSEYFYVNGILQKATIHHTLMSFNLELVSH